MLCTVLGYTRISGTSKTTGKPYDFCSVAVCYDAEKGYTGRRVKEFTLDPDAFQELFGVVPPFDVKVETDFSGRVLSIGFLT